MPIFTGRLFLLCWGTLTQTLKVKTISTCSRLWHMGW
ncbi:hypothetical protein MGSAQ_000168 [marine sediment metagenome]|uniref:Uncharacterized protein n=1 Tax=marine sediment metagenome TaxID=412755 RepID=A0A1B6NY37_9ZZZZ